MKVRSNHHWRNLLYGYELTETERAEFDYLDWTEDGDAQSHDFFRYRGLVYDTSEFMEYPDSANQRLDPDFAEFAKWNGYQSDSFFSGIVIRYSCDFERIQIGTYMS